MKSVLVQCDTQRFWVRDPKKVAHWKALARFPQGNNRVQILEEKEVEEVIEVRELIEVKEEVEEKEVVEVREVVIQELKEFKKKHGLNDIPTPPPPLKKNATKKEIRRYNKAYKLWKKKIKNISPPTKKQ